MPDEKSLILLGEQIKRIRESKKLSQADLAYKIGKDQPSINRLERGRINPSYQYLQQIAEGLELPISELLREL